MAKRVEAIIPRNDLSDRFLADRAGAAGKEKGGHAKDEGDRCHHNGAKPSARYLDRRLNERQALFLKIPGEFHDQDCIFTCNGDHENEADLGIKIVVETPGQNSEEDADERHGDDQDNGHR